jgi:hypothetical protein
MSPGSERWAKLGKDAVRGVTTAAVVEVAATSLILLVSPVLFGQLVFGTALSEPGQALGRLAGIALLGFALACWPHSDAPSAARAMLVYNLLAAIYLCYLGIAGTSVGLLLWPAVVLHLLLAALLAADRLARQSASSQRQRSSTS